MADLKIANFKDHQNGRYALNYIVDKTEFLFEKTGIFYLNSIIKIYSKLSIFTANCEMTEYH